MVHCGFLLTLIHCKDHIAFGVFIGPPGLAPHLRYSALSSNLVSFIFSDMRGKASHRNIHRDCQCALQNQPSTIARLPFFGTAFKKLLASPE